MQAPEEMHPHHKLLGAWHALVCADSWQIPASLLPSKLTPGATHNASRDGLLARCETGCNPHVQIVVELERQAVQVKEQQAEYDRARAAHAQMTRSLEACVLERRNLDMRLAEAKADVVRAARERRCGPSVA